LVSDEQIARDLFVCQARIRAFEEKVAELFAAGSLPGFVHLSIGQEAVAAGACLALGQNDIIVSNHRGHGHCLAKGGDPYRMMSELYGFRDGYGRGVGGSMHIADLDKGIYGANGIVGAGTLIATGAAFAFQVQGSDALALAFFGEGAANGGPFLESLNLASLWRLPIIFLCENNGYAEMSPQSVHMAGPGIIDRARAFGVGSAIADGTDALAVFEAVREAATEVRSGRGPRLIEARTNRWHGHFEGDPQKYRPAEELADARSKDPIELLKRRILDKGWADEAWLTNVKTASASEMAAAAKHAALGQPITRQEMLDQVYVKSSR
jgi:acetoin:2,6-dichlorophenolindophenol oxidoreductase subunit alpha